MLEMVVMSLWACVVMLNWDVTSLEGLSVGDGDEVTTATIGL
jgi:hypothetical protein